MLAFFIKMFKVKMFYNALVRNKPLLLLVRMNDATAFCVTKGHILSTIFKLQIHVHLYIFRFRFWAFEYVVYFFETEEKIKLSVRFGLSGDLCRFWKRLYYYLSKNWRLRIQICSYATPIDTSLVSNIVYFVTLFIY